MIFILKLEKKLILHKTGISQYFNWIQSNKAYLPVGTTFQGPARKTGGAEVTLGGEEDTGMQGLGDQKKEETCGRLRR